MYFNGSNHTQATHINRKGNSSVRHQKLCGCQSVLFACMPISQRSYYLCSVVFSNAMCSKLFSASYVYSFLYIMRQRLQRLCHNYYQRRLYKKTPLGMCSGQKLQSCVHRVCFAKSLYRHGNMSRKKCYRMCLKQLQLLLVTSVCLFRCVVLVIKCRSKRAIIPKGT